MISPWTVFSPLLKLFGYGALVLIVLTVCLGGIYFLMDLRHSK